MRRKTPLPGVTLVYAYSCKPLDEESKQLADRQIDLGCEYRNRLIKHTMICRNERTFAVPKDLSDEQTAQAEAAAKEARSRCIRSDREAYVARGLWYGTYWLAEEAAKAAVAARRKSGNRGEHGLGFDKGRLGAGIQADEIVLCGGEEIHGSKVSLVAQDVPGRYKGAATLKPGHLLTVSCGAGRQTRWVVKLHRPLPAGRILRAVITRRRTSSLANMKLRHDYFIQFTINTEDPKLQPAPLKNGLRAGLDLGWWSESDTIRVYDLVDENGHHERKLLPEYLISKHLHTHSLESIRDTGREGLKLKTWVRLAEESEEAAARRKQIAHIDSWVIAQERKSVRARREVYRLTARDLCQRYAVIYIEDMDLSKIAQQKNRRYRPENRVAGAPGEFRSILRQMAAKFGTSIVPVETAWTTQTCSLCGDESVWENPGEREHVCVACGERYERPWNSARNILQKGASRKTTSGAAE